MLFQGIPSSIEPAPPKAPPSVLGQGIPYCSIIANTLIIFGVRAASVYSSAIIRLTPANNSLGSNSVTVYTGLPPVLLDFVKL